MPATTRSAVDTTMDSTIKPAPSTPPSTPLPSSWDLASHFRSIFITRPALLTASSASSDAFLPTLPSLSLPVLDGVRAVLCVCMMMYHSFEFLLPYVPADAANELFNQPVMYLLSVGPVIVDWFFVLTGFLTALPLLQQEKRWLRQHKDNPPTNMPPTTDDPHRFTVSSFWYRRFSRFLPSWALTYAIHHLLLFPEVSMTGSALRNQIWIQLFSTMPATEQRMDGSMPSMCAKPGFLPLQLTMLVHLLPFGGCQGVMWSLGVQCQFYLFFPLLWSYLLRSSKRGGATAGQRLVRVMWCVIGLWSVIRVIAFFHQLTAPLAHIEGMAVFFWWYTNTVTRIGTIAAGVVLAHLCTSSSLPSYLHARPVLCYILHASHLLVLLLVRYTLEVQGEGPGTAVLLRTQPLVPMRVKADQHFPPSLAQLANIGHYWHYLVLNALLSVGSPVMAALICFSLVSLMHRLDSIGARLSQLLSSPVLAPVATLSYMAYLIHPSVQQYYYLRYTDHVHPHWLPTLPAFFSHTAFLTTLTFALSVLLYVLWDGPVVGWLGRVGRLSGGEVWMRRYAWLCVGLSVLCHGVMVPGLLFGYQPIEDASIRINDAHTYNPTYHPVKQS